MSKIHETGRSMVEMLGVLAIIGVLSVTGIYGYTVAMRSNRVNEIIHAASMLNSMGQALNNGQGDGELDYQDSFSDLPKGADFIRYNNHLVEIKTTDLTDCPVLVGKVGGSTSVSVVSPCAGGEVTLEFENSGSDNSDNGGSGSGEDDNYQNVDVLPEGECNNDEILRCFNGVLYGCIGGQWGVSAETDC